MARGEVVRRIQSADVVQRVASGDALQRLSAAVASKQRPRSAPNPHLKTLGETATELTRAARDAFRRATDDALRAALQRSGFDDHKSAELDAAVRRLEEQQRQTLSLLLELRTAATPMPAVPSPSELATPRPSDLADPSPGVLSPPGPAGMAAADLPAAKPTPVRTTTRRTPAKSNKVASARGSTAAKAKEATKAAKRPQPRKRAASATAAGVKEGTTPRAQPTSRSNNKSAADPTVAIRRGKNNAPTPVPDPEAEAPRPRRTRPLRARGR